MRKQMINQIVRHADDFIVICIDVLELSIIQTNITTFFAVKIKY